MSKVVKLNKDELDLSREGLPPELINQLKKNNTTSYDELLEVLKKLGDEFSLDDIIIANYRVNETVIRRPSMTAKLSAMSDKNMVERVGKGKYKLL